MCVCSRMDVEEKDRRSATGGVTISDGLVRNRTRAAPRRVRKRVPGLD